MTQQSLLQSQTNANIQPNLGYSESQPTKLRTFEQITDTPLFVVGDDENGYFGVMGKYMITDKFQTKNDVIELVQAKPYELLITIMHLVIELNQQLKSTELISSSISTTP